MIKFRFWGVRGSTPCPGPDTVKYGGNTACIEFRFGEEEKLVILDAGSGLRQLGNNLMKTELPKGPMNIELLLSHTHWDHIMGFPFFTPIYIPGTTINVRGPVTYEEDGLDKIIGDQLSYRYFPVKHSELSADIKYYPLKESTFEIGDGIFTTTKYLNHPILCLGYRFEYKGKSIVTAYDTEPFTNLFPTDPEDPDYDQMAAEEGDLVAKEENDKIMNFMRGADILIHDSQYTKEEYYKSFQGWGHSTYEYVINMAHKAGVKKVYFFHHDPLRTDKQLDDLLELYREKVKGKTNLKLELAREGQEITL
ncbi:MAG: MBL fold metallo-hydrolase [Spirochaetales bacterium]|nr:MBL fold metallo-hydrolase [Spirochaetales bacterium]